LGAGEVKTKIKIKGNGQECPFHMSNGNININIKSGAEGVRGSHSSQRAREMGHALLIWVQAESKSKARSTAKATDGSVRST
jgi:hypothetical protein